MYVLEANKWPQNSCTDVQTIRRQPVAAEEVNVKSKMFTTSRPQEPQEFSDTYCLQLNAT